MVTPSTPCRLVPGARMLRESGLTDLVPGLGAAAIYIGRLAGSSLAAVVDARGRAVVEMRNLRMLEAESELRESFGR